MNADANANADADVEMSMPSFPNGHFNICSLMTFFSYLITISVLQSFSVLSDWGSEIDREGQKSVQNPVKHLFLSLFTNNTKVNGFSCFIIVLYVKFINILNTGFFI